MTTLVVATRAAVDRCGPGRVATPLSPTGTEGQGRGGGITRCTSRRRSTRILFPRRQALGTSLLDVEGVLAAGPRPDRLSAVSAQELVERHTVVTAWLLRAGHAGSRCPLCRSWWTGWWKCPCQRPSSWHAAGAQQASLGTTSPAGAGRCCWWVAGSRHDQWLPPDGFTASPGRFSNSVRRQCHRSRSRSWRRRFWRLTSLVNMQLEYHVREPGGASVPVHRQSAGHSRCATEKGTHCATTRLWSRQCGNCLEVPHTQSPSV